MAKVLLFGSYGLLGRSLSPWLIQRGHEVICQGRGSDAQFSVDPTDATALIDALDHYRPDVVINLIAATNVDRCEEVPQEAFLANVRVVEAIAQALVTRSHYGIHFIHLSTDQVYDGIGPHIEANAMPCNVYGLTKYTGELIAQRVNATVLRTNFVGRSNCASRTSFSDWIVTSLQLGKEITVFDDVLFGALHISTLCDVIERAMIYRASGIFNAGCQDGISKAGFAIRLAQLLELNMDRMKVGTCGDVVLRARRPLDMRLNNTQIEHQLHWLAPTMEEQIQLTAMEYNRA